MDQVAVCSARDLPSFLIGKKGFSETTYVKRGIVRKIVDSVRTGFTIGILC